MITLTAICLAIMTPMGVANTIVSIIPALVGALMIYLAYMP